jgi:AAHS family 4-hydroxybenzoate transporter-like MFS transporter
MEKIVTLEMKAADASQFELDQLIDGQKIQPFTIIFLVVATLAMISDGFDLGAIGFVAPELVKEWHIAPAQLAPLLSAGILGMLSGGPLFGYIGDRVGRKNAILIALGIYGAFTIITMAVSSLEQIIALRFLTGIGLGGMIPNILALTAETASKRWRGKFTIIVLFGVPVGLAIPGWVAALLVPQYGWKVLLLVGGILPLAVAAFFALQESLKFLVRRGDRDDEARRAVRTLRPDLAIDDGARFSTGSTNEVVASGSPGKLFRDKLSVITVALWIALAANRLTNFFAISWLPTLLQSAGLTTAQAGMSASMFSIGGMIGGLVLAFMIDRFGVVPLVLLFVAGAPLIALVGAPNLPPAAISGIIAAAGFCVIGNNFGINAAMVMIYPTPIRSTGAGWAQGFGRVGALLAPAMGGILLGMNVSSQELYLVPALVLLVGAVASGILLAQCVRRFGGYRLNETISMPPSRAQACPL